MHSDFLSFCLVKNGNLFSQSHLHNAPGISLTNLFKSNQHTNADKPKFN